MTADVELLPCPFCGGKPELTMKGNVHSTRKCVVKCTECRYQRTDAALRYGDEWLRSTAVAAWNRRATAAKDAEIEALRAEVERLRMGVCGDACLHIAIERDQLKARAERLAEALRKARARIDHVVHGDAGMETLLEVYDLMTAALHPTAAQEGNDHG